MSKKLFWGENVGNQRIRVISLDDALNVINAVAYAHDDTPEKIEAVTKDLAMGDAAVNMSDRKVVLRSTKLPPIDQRKLAVAIRYEAQQQIPFDLNEVVWKSHVFDTDYQQEVLIVAARLEEIKQRVATLGFVPSALVPECLAICNALKLHEFTEKICHINGGSENATLIVGGRGTMWARNIPIGGDRFTKCLEKEFKLSTKKAEKLKKDATDSKYARQIFQTMRPVFADFVAEIERSLGFVESTLRGEKITQITVSGGMFKLPGLTKFLDVNLKHMVRPVQESSLWEKDLDPEFIISYGLALQMAGQAPINCDLRSKEMKKSRMGRIGRIRSAFHSFVKGALETFE
jgi:type IV pilus assembly protein PilM